MLPPHLQNALTPACTVRLALTAIGLIYSREPTRLVPLRNLGYRLNPMSKPPSLTQRLSHLNEKGEANMVDVSAKDVTHRVARAEGFVAMAAETLALPIYPELTDAMLRHVVAAIGKFYAS